MANEIKGLTRHNATINRRNVLRGREACHAKYKIQEKHKA